MERSHLTRSATFQAPQGAEGIVEGLVTTWDDPYHIGSGFTEEISRTALDASIETSFPVYFEHNHLRGAAPIGVARARKTDEGLLVRAELFLDNPEAASVYRAMQAGALREWSVGMTVAKDDYVRVDRTKRFVVRSADLFEVSIVNRGMNPSTDTTSVRSAAVAATLEEAEVQPVEDTEPPATESVVSYDHIDLRSPLARRLVRELLHSQKEN